MRVAAIYDVHGNLPALEAVLGDVRAAGVDRIVVGGDVLPGPMPRETLACLDAVELPIAYIVGNGDRAVLERMRGSDPRGLPEQAREVVRWTAEQLDPAIERRLARWPATLRLAIDGLGDVMFCHATPRSDTEIFTRMTSEERLRPVFEGVGAAVVVCGHTHMQFDRTIGGVRVVNAGSVGMPYGEPRACWLLLGPGLDLRRTPYDLASAADRIGRTTYPQAKEFVERDLLRPRSETEMCDLFSRAELR
jgi:putative phosphoesterase